MSKKFGVLIKSVIYSSESTRIRTFRSVEKNRLSRSQTPTIIIYFDAEKEIGQFEIIGSSNVGGLQELTRNKFIRTVSSA